MRFLKPFLLLMIAYAGFFTLLGRAFPEFLDSLSREDHLVESLSALVFLAAFAVSAVYLPVARGRRTRLLLAGIAVVGLLTIVGSVYMILYSRPLYEIMHRLGLLRMFRASQQDEPAAESTITHGHVIVVGMNALGKRLARVLHDRGERVLAIDTDNRKLADLPCETLSGNVDYLSFLQEAGLPRAKLAVTALQIEDVNLLFAYRCGRLGVPVAVHVFDRSVLHSTLEVAPQFVIDSKQAADNQIEKLLAEMGVISS